MKSRRDGLIIAQGKRGTSVALGPVPPEVFSLSPRGTSGERAGEGLGRGVSQIDRSPLAALN